MFDIGFWELALIAVVALLVIGPERLPGVARNVGMWVGRAKRFVHSVQSDINAEVSKTEELKALLEQQNELKAMHEIIEDTTNEIREGVSVPAAKPTPVVKAMTDDAEPAGEKAGDAESSAEKPADTKHG